ncbi:hypothetical protein [Amycolatopsis sp. CA-126428]|uniref:hypothetical protein n=1 Tax=Amycolatopsis sp. CA-126428 TaxID=2073158 RepID=UPI0011B086FF|nr:hypothetical protein [Amycolatopsis sp. CA-126428]
MAKETRAWVCGDDRAELDAELVAQIVLMMARQLQSETLTDSAQDLSATASTERRPPADTDEVAK